MSRGQQATVINTAESNSGADQTAASDAIKAENTDIGSYEQQLSKFAASNPYTAGGEYQTSQNQTLAANADAGSKAIMNQEQTQAQRTGQNAAGGIATAAEAARQNERDLSSAEGSANDTRIGDEAGYNQTTLNATAVPAQLEQGEYATSVGAANQALGTAGSSASTPGFWDTLGDSFAGALGKTGGGGGCWVAAELYGGWDDPRTIAVRAWIFGEFAETRIGAVVAGLYLAHGERIAACIHRHRSLRFVFLPLFNAALRQARKGR